jgi:hypothetical protein
MSVAEVKEVLAQMEDAFQTNATGRFIYAYGLK